MCFCYLRSGQGIADCTPSAPASACQQGPCRACLAELHPACTLCMREPTRSWTHPVQTCTTASTPCCPSLATDTWNRFKGRGRRYRSALIEMNVFNLWRAFQLALVAQAGTKALLDLWHGNSGLWPLCVDFLNPRIREVSKDRGLICSNTVIKSY